VGSENRTRNGAKGINTLLVKQEVGSVKGESKTSTLGMKTAVLKYSAQYRHKTRSNRYLENIKIHFLKVIVFVETLGFQENRATAKAYLFG